eukprot:1162036-Pelagomonas_calceolata.AAC.15
MAAIKQQQKCPACKVSCLQPGLPGEQSLKNHDSTTHQHSPSVSWTSAAEVSHLWESSPLSRLPGKLDFKRLDSMAQNWGSMPQPVIHLDGSSRGAQLARRDACKGRVAPCGGGWFLQGLLRTRNSMAAMRAMHACIRTQHLHPNLLAHAPPHPPEGPAVGPRASCLRTHPHPHHAPAAVAQP